MQYAAKWRLTCAKNCINEFAEAPSTGPTAPRGNTSCDNEMCTRCNYGVRQHTIAKYVASEALRRAATFAKTIRCGFFLNVMARFRLELTCVVELCLFDRRLFAKYMFDGLRDEVFWLFFFQVSFSCFVIIATVDCDRKLADNNRNCDRKRS